MEGYAVRNSTVVISHHRSYQSCSLAKPVLPVIHNLRSNTFMPKNILPSGLGWVSSAQEVLRVWHLFKEGWSEMLHQQGGTQLSLMLDDALAALSTSVPAHSHPPLLPSCVLLPESAVCLLGPKCHYVWGAHPPSPGDDDETQNLNFKTGREPGLKFC